MPNTPALSKKILFSLTLLLLTFFASAQNAAVDSLKKDPAMQLLGKLNPNRTSYDVHFYHLNLGLDYENQALAGSVKIAAKALTDIDSLQLDLKRNFTIQSITYQDSVLHFYRKYDAVIVQFPKAIPSNTYFEIIVHYSGTPQVAENAPWSGGFVWTTDKDGNPFAGVACQGEGASLWWPCKDHATDEPDSAQMDFTITANHLSVISNGRYLGSKIKKGKKTFSWKVVNPINLYDITFYLGNYKRLTDTYTNADGEKLDLEHYVLERNFKTAQKHFPQVKQHIATFEWAFGKYNWYQDGFKLVECPYLGMEHQSAIAYGNHFQNDLFGKDDYIILHETGHEWFGNAITVADYAGIWLQEGITTYSEAIYLEHNYGKQLAEVHMKRYRLILKNKFPIVGPTGIRYFDPHDGDVYFKGAWVMHTFRNALDNDSLFFDVIRTFYDTFKSTTCTTKDFLNTVNEVTGKDFTTFFQPYLHQAALPKLQYFHKGKKLYYKMTNVPEGFSLPIKIKSGDEVLTLYATPGLQEAKTKSNPTFDPTRVLYDLEKVATINDLK